MDSLPNELIIEIILRSENLKDLEMLCKVSKKFYDICKTEYIAKQIMKKLVKFDKPSIFKTYSGFFKHYSKISKTLHPDFLLNFYKNILPEILKNKDKKYIEKFQKKFI